MPATSKPGMSADAFLSAVESASFPERLALGREIVDLIKQADGLRPLLGIVRAPVVAIAPALGSAGVNVDGLTKDEAAAFLSETEPFVSVQLAESGSTKSARRSAAVVSSVDGSVLVKGGPFAKPSLRTVAAESASGWNSVRDAIAKKMVPDADSAEHQTIKRTLDAWISADDQRSTPVDLGNGVTAEFVQ